MSIYSGFFNIPNTLMATRNQNRQFSQDGLAALQNMFSQIGDKLDFDRQNKGAVNLAVQHGYSPSEAQNAADSMGADALSQLVYSQMAEERQRKFQEQQAEQAFKNQQTLQNAGFQNQKDMQNAGFTHDERMGKKKRDYETEDRDLKRLDTQYGQLMENLRMAMSQDTEWDKSASNSAKKAVNEFVKKYPEKYAQLVLDELLGGSPAANNEYGINTPTEYLKKYNELIDAGNLADVAKFVKWGQNYLGSSGTSIYDAAIAQGPSISEKLLSKFNIDESIPTLARIKNPKEYGNFSDDEIYKVHTRRLFNAAVNSAYNAMKAQDWSNIPDLSEDVLKAIEKKDGGKPLVETYRAVKKRKK